MTPAGRNDNTAGSHDDGAVLQRLGMGQSERAAADGRIAAVGVVARKHQPAAAREGDAHGAVGAVGDRATEGQ